MSVRWNSDWTNDAVVFVKRGLFGDIFHSGTALDLLADKAQVLFDTFIEPIDQLVQSRFVKELNFNILSRLIRSKLKPGFLRLLLLWIIDCWRPWKVRMCLKCRESHTSLPHVIDCTGLQRFLDQDSSLPSQPAHSPPLPRSRR